MYQKPTTEFISINPEGVVAASGVFLMLSGEFTGLENESYQTDAETISFD